MQDILPNRKKELTSGNKHVDDTEPNTIFKELNRKNKFFIESLCS